MAAVLLVVFCSFLLGGIPFSFLLGKLKGMDLRKFGSGNIGATNLTRAAGRLWGYLAFVLDFLKGFIPVGLVPLLLSENHSLSQIQVQILCGLAAVLGHIFPVYLKFRGGKGVATSFGVLASLMWPSAATAGAVWGIVFLITRFVSLASLLAALSFPISVFFFYRAAEPSDFYALEALAVIIAILILVRHRSNIQRLVTGKEHRFDHR